MSVDRSHRPSPAASTAPAERDNAPIGLDATGRPQPLDEEIHYCVMDGVPVKVIQIPGYEIEALAFDPRSDRLIAAPHLALRFERARPALIDRAEFERRVRAGRARR